VLVEATHRQAGFLHQFGDSDSGKAFFPESPSGDFTMRCEFYSYRPSNGPLRPLLKNLQLNQIMNLIQVRIVAIIQKGNQNIMRLEKKVALITGGNSGIGFGDGETVCDEGAYVFIPAP